MRRTESWRRSSSDTKRIDCRRESDSYMVPHRRGCSAARVSDVERKHGRARLLESVFAPITATRYKKLLGGYAALLAVTSFIKYAVLCYHHTSSELPFMRTPILRSDSSHQSSSIFTVSKLYIPPRVGSMNGKKLLPAEPTNSTPLKNISGLSLGTKNILNGSC